jgi:hypothetical protein
LEAELSENGNGSSMTAPRLQVVILGVARIVPNLSERRFGKARPSLVQVRIALLGVALLRDDHLQPRVGRQLVRFVQHDLLSVKMCVQRFHSGYHIAPGWLTQVLHFGVASSLLRGGCEGRGGNVRGKRTGHRSFHQRFGSGNLRGDDYGKACSREPVELSRVRH